MGKKEDQFHLCLSYIYKSGINKKIDWMAESEIYIYWHRLTFDIHIQEICNYSFLIMAPKTFLIESQKRQTRWKIVLTMKGSLTCLKEGYFRNADKTGVVSDKLKKSEQLPHSSLIKMKLMHHKIHLWENFQ